LDVDIVLMVTTGVAKLECRKALKPEFMTEFQEKFWEEKRSLQVVGCYGEGSLECPFLGEGRQVV
jgi:hypothetical protein